LLVTLPKSTAHDLHGEACYAQAWISDALSGTHTNPRRAAYGSLRQPSAEKDKNMANVSRGKVAVVTGAASGIGGGYGPEACSDWSEVLLVDSRADGADGRRIDRRGRWRCD